MSHYTVTVVGRGPVPSDHPQGRDVDFARPAVRFETLEEAKFYRARMRVEHPEWEVTIARSDERRSFQAERFTPAEPEVVALALKKARAALNREAS